MKNSELSKIGINQSNFQLSIINCANYFSVLASTKVIAITGYSGISPTIAVTRKSELIDINDECSSVLPDYPLGVIGATGVYIDGKIVVCGGAYQPIPQTPLIPPM